MRSALRAGDQPALAAFRADPVFPDESARARDARRRAVTGRRVDPDRARHAALAVVEPSVRQEERRDLVSRDHACDGPATGRDDGAPSSRRDAGTSPRAPWRSRCSRCGRRSRRASRARPRADSSRARSASSGTSGVCERPALRVVTTERSEANKNIENTNSQGDRGSCRRRSRRSRVARTPRRAEGRRTPDR